MATLNIEEKPMSQDDSYAFETAEKLVGYMELHAKTPRALVRFDHLAHLAYIAGWDVSEIEKKDVENTKHFVSLHSYPHNIILNACGRLQKNLVPENWRELFNAMLDEKERIKNE